MVTTMNAPNDLTTAILEKGLEKLRALEADRLKLDKDICLLRYEIQEACPHPEEEVVEAHHVYLESDDSAPPFRVCKVCGRAEEQWGHCGSLCHYHFDVIRTVPREEAITFIRGHLLTQKALDLIERKRAEAAA